MKHYRSIKVSEETYNNIILIQHLLWHRKRVQFTKGKLLDFLVKNFISHILKENKREKTEETY